jgi:hypothetical protein
VLIEVPENIPASSTLWAYAPTPGGTGSSWQPLATTISGNRATAVLSGTAGNGGNMQGVVALAVDDSVPSVQDMWWAGAEENGWGLSLAQSGSQLFVAFFIYNDDGTPQWVVMPGGSWDSTKRVFNGSLYRPRGSTNFSQYNATDFRPGDAVGTATLSFASGVAATLDYTLDGKSGRKSIRRLPISSASSPVQGNHAGLWWGGLAQNGWGVAIGHQDDTLFAVVYSYDDAGRVQWYVMPGGQWTSETDNLATEASTYKGTLYRTTGSPWVGSTYDPGRLVTMPAGSLALEFKSKDIAHMRLYIPEPARASALKDIVKMPF